MTQSRRASLAETACNVILGCAVNWSWLFFAFPPLLLWLGASGAATVTTVTMIGLSSLRLYAVRRCFNR